MKKKGSLRERGGREMKQVFQRLHNHAMKQIDDTESSSDYGNFLIERNNPSKLWYSP